MALIPIRTLALCSDDYHQGQSTAGAPHSCRCLLLLVVFVCLVLLPAAHAYPGLTNGTYRIVSRNSGQVLSVWAGATTNGSSAVQWPWNGGSDQDWQLLNIVSNQYAITNKKAVGKYLDVYGGVGATGNGANVNIWDPPSPGNPANNQKWIIQPTGDNYNTYTLAAVHSGKLLDVDGVSFANGANVQQWTAAGGLNQEWYIESVQLQTPTGLAASSSNGLVSLTWNALPGSARFNIKRSTTNGSGYTNIATNVRGTNYYDSMLTTGTTYYYVVANTNVAGESTNSTQASATPLSFAQQWRWDNFGTITNSGNAADSADPDGDGLANSGERIFGGNPNTNDANSLFTHDPAHPLLSVLYNKSKSAGDYEFTVQESSVPFTNPWTAASGTYQIVTTTGSVQVTGFTTSASSAITRFLRISAEPKDRPRVIVTTDGEADDQASMVRFLLTCNEFEVEAIVNSSSQFHWVGPGAESGFNAFHRFEWFKDFVNLYAQVYPNLLQHDPNYPSPEYLVSRWKVGNITANNAAGALQGEDDIRTEGAKLIAEILLDASDPRPIWLQAWGGCNTISRALKIIEEDHPLRMAEVAAKIRLYLIWEQDQTYRDYIYGSWEGLGVQTIIADSFDCVAYEWKKDLPDSLKASHFNSPWASSNIAVGHGALCATYVNTTYDNPIPGEFNPEGDTPSFLHAIPNGLRSTESPGFGGWGGRFTNIRSNVWMDFPPAASGTWTYPNPAAGGWRYIDNSWAKTLLGYPKVDRENYFKVIWRWMDDVQNDFAARADWCVMNYASANHHPVVRLKTPLNLNATPGQLVTLDATPTSDPDGDALNFRWWNYFEADTYPGAALSETNAAATTITIPAGAAPGQDIHMICEVTDTGTPPLTRYHRVIIHVVSP